jgi:outer membrane immunogenic protein
VRDHNSGLGDIEMKFAVKLALAAAGLAAFSNGAMAADLMVMHPAPAMAPMAPATTSWDGLYIGANVGYGWGSLAPTSGASVSTTGWLVDGHVGYNAHLSDQIVGGIEGDLDWSNVSGTGYTTNWGGSLRGRLGLDVGGFLPYAELGVAFANGTLSGTSATHTGWTAGVGVEYMLTNQLSANLEYRYSDYGSQNYGASSQHLTDSTVRIGLNYHF